MRSGVAPLGNWDGEIRFSHPRLHIGGGGGAVLAQPGKVHSPFGRSRGGVQSKLVILDEPLKELSTTFLERFCFSDLGGSSSVFFRLN